MAITLGENRYGKAETRVVRVCRPSDGGQHVVEDLNVGISLSGDLAATHLTGDNANVLPTDTQKNTVFAFARTGIGSPEAFSLRLARHFVATQQPITQARVVAEQYGWRPIGAAGPAGGPPSPVPHSFRRDGDEVRTVVVTHTADVTRVVSGVRGLVLLNTTSSEFWGYPRDRYTTLPETTDRMLATAVDARWRWAGLPASADSPTSTAWNEGFAAARAALLQAFGHTHSRSLQQSLYAMGEKVLEAVPALAAVRLALPNRHHFLVDLSPFDLDNPGVVYYAADRPYGLIEGTVLRDDVRLADLDAGITDGTGPW